MLRASTSPVVPTALTWDELPLRLVNVGKNEPFNAVAELVQMLMRVLLADSLRPDVEDP